MAHVNVKMHVGNGAFPLEKALDIFYKTLYKMIRPQEII